MRLGIPPRNRHENAYSGTGGSVLGHLAKQFASIGARGLLGGFSGVEISIFQGFLSERDAVGESPVCFSPRFDFGAGLKLREAQARVVVVDVHLGSTRKW